MSIYKLLFLSVLFITFGNGELLAKFDQYPYGVIDQSNNINSFFQVERKDKGPILAQLGINNSFALNQKKIIENSFKLMLQRILSPQVISCAFMKSFKHRPISKTEFIMQLEDALTGVTVAGSLLPSFVFVANYQNDKKSVGVGYVNLFYDTDYPFPGFPYRHYLHFALNMDYLGKHENYVYANDLEYWAGVMAHEILHNLGYIHPDGLQGSFIHSFGKCVQNNGAQLMEIEEENSLNEELEDLEIIK